MSSSQKKTHALSQAALVFEPAIERSVVVNQEGMDKVRPTLAADSNEWTVMVAWSASRAVIDRMATWIPVHLHAL